MNYRERIEEVIFKTKMVPTVSEVSGILLEMNKTATWREIAMEIGISHGAAYAISRGAIPKSKSVREMLLMTKSTIPVDCVFVSGRKVRNKKIQEMSPEEIKFAFENRS